MAARLNTPRLWGVGILTVALAAGAFMILTLATDESRRPPDTAAARFDTGIQLDPDQVPSVFGYDASSAREVLENSGLEVTEEPVPGCAYSGRAVGTEPDTGSRFQRGDEVVLQISVDSPVVDCAGPSSEIQLRAWQFLDFANGRGPAPLFANEVDLFVNGEKTATLTATEAEDPASWGAGSALDLLVAQSSRVERWGGEFRTPVLNTARDDGTIHDCGPDAPLPRHLTRRESQVVAAYIPTNGLIGGCELVNVFRTEHGEIDAVAMRFRGLTPPDSTDEPLAEASQEMLEVGRSFTRFSRGTEDSLPVAPSVDLYLGNVFQQSIGSEAQDRRAWRIPCARYAGRICPVSPVATVVDGGVVVEEPTRPRTSTACATAMGDLPEALAAAPALNWSVALSQPEPASCREAWEVQIWFDEEGLIFAVNLLHGAA